MRDVLLSNCEKHFILKCINDKQRIDTRNAFEYRTVKICFGSDFGSCQVELGDTRVFAQVSAELGAPRATRPKDGVLHINVELSPMASPSFEVGRMSDQAVELNRLLERCIKDSNCIDTESLCVLAGEKVWVIRVDVTVLNHEGNILDCACIAAICALSHFRRNEVTVDHKLITIHPHEDRAPVPLSVIHMPLCITFAFFVQGKYILVDPSEKEERVMEGKMIVGMNKHREICTMQAVGTMLVLREQILRCTNMAAVKVKEITDLIVEALSVDAKKRSSGGDVGFNTRIDVPTPLKVAQKSSSPSTKDCDQISEMSEDIDAPQPLGGHKPEHNPVLKLNDPNSFIGELDRDAEMELEVEQKVTQQTKPRSQHSETRSSGSEEEPVTLQTDDTKPSNVVKKTSKKKTNKNRKALKKRK